MTTNETKFEALARLMGNPRLLAYDGTHTKAGLRWNRACEAIRRGAEPARALALASLKLIRSKGGTLAVKHGDSTACNLTAEECRLLGETAGPGND